MSYERESIPDSVTINTSTASPVTRPGERIIDPYQGRSELSGQPDINKPSQVETKTEETVKLSPQVAALARREQKFRLQEQQLKKDRESLAAQTQEIAELRAMKEKLAAKDYSGLEGLVDYNEYSQYQVNKINGSDPVQEEIKKLNEKLNGIEKNSQENITRQFDAAVAERRTAAIELVDKTTEFPRIKKAKAHEAVVQHILDTWEHDSKELTVEQAAKEVEETLLEKAKQWSMLLEEPKEDIPDAKKPLPPLKPGLKTLTNQVTSGDVKRPMKSLRDMNDNERWAEARRRAEEKLQQTRR